MTHQLLGELPKDIWEQIIGLVPLQSVFSIRATSRSMRNSVDSVCAKRGFRACCFTARYCLQYRCAGKPSSALERIWRHNGDVGAALWFCFKVNASWLHHLACVGTPYQVAHAIRLGESVEGCREISNPHMSEMDRDACGSMSPLMLACALGRTAVVEVLLQVSSNGSIRKDALVGPSMPPCSSMFFHASLLLYAA